MMRKKKLLTTAMILGMMACGLLMGKGNEADAATVTETKPSIVGNEKVIYLDSKDKIAIQGDRIVSVKYTSSRSKVAVISKKGTITPKKKGKTTIKATVVYRKKAGGKKYTKKLSYKLQVFGKVKTYFNYKKTLYSDYCYKITGLTEKGKKLSSIYMPECINKYEVSLFDDKTFEGNDKLENLYLADNIKSGNIYNCSNLKKISLGKNFERKSYYVSVWKGCSKLEKIDVDPRNKDYKLVDGVLFSGNTLCYYSAKKAGASYEVPSNVENIGIRAFENCTNLKSITLNDNVSNFGSYCFAGSGLTSIKFSDEIETLSTGMFANCTSLREVTLSKRMRSIPELLFYNCDSLKSILLPASVNKIDGSAFANCIQFTEINVSATNSNYKVEDGILYNKNGTKLVLYPSGRKDTSYSVKSGINKIGSGAFYAATALEQVILPNTLNEIEYGAFVKSGLKEITIPDSVKKINGGVFENCLKLSKITLPQNIVNIEPYTFENCKSLTQITLPKELIKIDVECFVGCDNLSVINVDESNTTYTSVDGILYSKSKQTFYYYPNGKKGSSFTVPKTTKIIKGYAFSGVRYLKNLSILDETNQLNKYAFWNAKSIEKISLPKEVSKGTELRFTNCSSLKEITLPNGCENPDWLTFSGCSSLEEITLPNSVTRLYSPVLDDCMNLKKITFGSKLKTIRSLSFDNCKKLKKIVIKSKILKASSIEKNAFKGAGSDNYKKLVVKVPASKKSVYRKIFQKKGLSKKATVK